MGRLDLSLEIGRKSLEALVSDTVALALGWMEPSE